jgi:hypothetical protein
VARCRATGVRRAGQVAAGDDFGVFVECVGWGQLWDDHVRGVCPGSFVLLIVVFQVPSESDIR